MAAGLNGCQGCRSTSYSNPPSPFLRNRQWKTKPVAWHRSSAKVARASHSVAKTDSISLGLGLGHRCSSTRDHIAQAYAWFTPGWKGRRHLLSPREVL
ncbi:hypothetical protein OE88DRAFT_1656483 [Heliocybe sulcata]|uniref:Uncharacterized protein n=1 Tax=Heliocybe sulcata TaxID=5364 RepID=A0A5C3N719_9AGAM|nr:hypothetical protein OE88DRAFT_1656483 [Heliocybe sulcata]